MADNRIEIRKRLPNRRIVFVANQSIDGRLSHTRQRTDDVLKNRFISNYFMIAAFSSPVKCSKIVFPF